MRISKKLHEFLVAGGMAELQNNFPTSEITHHNTGFSKGYILISYRVKKNRRTERRGAVTYKTKTFYNYHIKRLLEENPEIKSDYIMRKMDGFDLWGTE